MIRGNLYDLQAKLNLNNVLEKNYYAVYLRLLQKALPNDNDAQKTIAAATRQWISPYVPGRGQDAFFTDYAQQKPPYYPSQQPMASISEFRLLKGVSAKQYQSLHDLIIALPESTAININRAPKTLLMTLNPGLNEEQVNDILNARSKTGFIDKKDLPALIDKLRLSSQEITLESQYYLSVAEVSSAEYTLINYVILKRQTEKNGDLSLSLVSQSFNTL